MKPIKDYERYCVTEKGNVINTATGRTLKTDITGCGYARVTLSVDNVPNRQSVHRLVAKAYIPNPDEKPFVNHIDGNKLNNTVSNLEWVTCSENFLHAQEIGLRPIGSKRSTAKLDEVVVSKVCEMLQSGCKRGEILSAGIHPDLKRHMVDNIRRRRTWKHVSKDYRW